jgi:hypothetical protein
LVIGLIVDTFWHPQEQLFTAAAYGFSLQIFVAPVAGLIIGVVFCVRARRAQKQSDLPSDGAARDLSGFDNELDEITLTPQQPTDNRFKRQV